ncbi:BadF/BadG/BcrA/BcrD ATPase family protein [Cohnella nanjingensis]|uniref:ATPase n=1 Tax=Cohnella nanjingensis TaxID=1387779 RepID=A0A7X0RQX5_9BACL|nr:BadF/BadG/BcrA/BcrD ATPase family protein [Cohnella nanjingensis]MBB6672018.1 ATPase [Cohnella nanjingensis]
MSVNGIVIGVDGGGTHTRVMICDVAGNVLSYAAHGAASVYKDASATQNVRNAMRSALEKAGKTTREVLGVAAGIAGYDSEEDLAWVEPLTDLPGLACPKWHVNDAIVAHYGAFMAQPGIIVISGTGSIIVGIAEDGRPLRNYDFRHYAASAARFIAYDAVYEVLAGNADSTDDGLVQSMLAHWDVRSIAEFYSLARTGFEEDRQERDLRFGRFAPFVTAAADRGSAVAIRVSDRAIAQIRVGIELLAPAFSDDTVPVAFTGSVVASPYFSRSLKERLQAGKRKRFAVVQPRFSPAAGAVLLAMSRLNLPIDEAVISNLQKIQPSQC